MLNSGTGPARALSLARKDTIYALSSGRLPAAIAVVRVSGPQTAAAVEALTTALPEPRRAALRILRDPRTADVIDEGLLLWFPGPKSETGEDTAEFQIHGGSAVVAALFEALRSVPGLRPAEAGEFTRRAFENERLDLTRVEALADLVHAGTEAQRRQALSHLQGLLAGKAEAWRCALVGAMARVEAALDFPDEEDVPKGGAEDARRTVETLRDEIVGALADACRGERVRDGLVVAIAGPPNAGKSSLLNQLARREAALVSDQPGTTRDVIEVQLDLGGYPLTLLDTAGIRMTDDPLERAGIERAVKRASAADLVLWLHEATDDARCGGELRLGRGSEVWLLRSKADLLESDGLDREAGLQREPANTCLLVSARTGQGLPMLLDRLTAFAMGQLGCGEPALVTRERHRALLSSACEALSRALEVAPGARDDIFAEELRIAATALGRLVGRIDVEDVLDSVFRDFCIGK